MTFSSLDRVAIKPRRMPPLSIVLFGFMPLAAMLLVGLFGPLLLTVDPNRQDLGAAYASPSTDYLLGADNLGRSIAARLVAGTRISLGIALPEWSLHWPPVWCSDFWPRFGRAG